MCWHKRSTGNFAVMDEAILARRVYSIELINSRCVFSCPILCLACEVEVKL